MFRFQQLTGRPGGETSTKVNINSVVPFGRGLPSSSSTSISSTNIGGRQSGGTSKKEIQVAKNSQLNTMIINNVHNGPTVLSNHGGCGGDAATATGVNGIGCGGLSLATTQTEYSTPTEYTKVLIELWYNNYNNGSTEIESIRNKFKFVQPSDGLLDSYTIEAVNTIRSNDISKMQALLDKGQNFNACNRNGETLLHMVCRCCTVDIVKFLINVANVNINVVDSVGRNVLHDICWRHRLDVDMMMLFVNTIDPYMFVMPDNRGHTCFDYCRKEHYTIWIDFLKLNASKIFARSKTVDLNNSNTSKSEGDDAVSNVTDNSVESITIGGKVFTPLKNSTEEIEVEPALTTKVSVVRKTTSPSRRLSRPNVQKREELPSSQPIVKLVSRTTKVATLKRKDSSSLTESTSSLSYNEIVDLTSSSSCSSSRTSSPVRTMTHGAVQVADRYSAVHFNDDSSLMNGPLRKKSNSMVNLQELDDDNEACYVSFTNSKITSLQQKDHQSVHLRRVHSAICPLQTLAAVAVAALQDKHTASSETISFVDRTNDNNK
jgi:Ankyrin repeats (many copies)